MQELPRKSQSLSSSGHETTLKRSTKACFAEGPCYRAAFAQKENVVIHVIGASDVAELSSQATTQGRPGMIPQQHSHRPGAFLHQASHCSGAGPKQPSHRPRLLEFKVLPLKFEIFLQKLNENATKHFC